MNQQAMDLQALADQILNSKKYRGTGLNRQTVEDVLRQEAPNHPSTKALLKVVRRKLHNIVAPYLGELDSAQLAGRLAGLDEGVPGSPGIKAFCREVLAAHASTAERLPHMEAFYARLFQAVGRPDSILDLACGLHPLAFPWMDLPKTTAYHAYDIRQPRIDFINQFFVKIGLAPLARNQDVLVTPPDTRADLALFFKEAHRFEKRQPGCNRDFWRSLHVDTLAVSLPAEDLSGNHPLIDRHRRLVQANLPENKVAEELQLENEVIFIIKEPWK